MSILKFFKKDKREKKQFYEKAAKKIERIYSPFVGDDDNGMNEPTVKEAISRIKPINIKLKEVDFYA